VFVFVVVVLSMLLLSSCCCSYCYVVVTQIVVVVVVVVTPTQTRRGGVSLGSSRAHAANGQHDPRIALALDNHMDVGAAPCWVTRAVRGTVARAWSAFHVGVIVGDVVVVIGRIRERNAILFGRLGGEIPRIGISRAGMLRIGLLRWHDRLDLLVRHVEAMLGPMAEVEPPGVASPFVVVVVTKTAKVFEEQRAVVRLFRSVLLDELINLLLLGCPQDATPKIVTLLAIGLVIGL
jgi:hypothetical protein